MLLALIAEVEFDDFDALLQLLERFLVVYFFVLGFLAIFVLRLVWQLRVFVGDTSRIIITHFG